MDNLETRICAGGCGRTFRCLSSSKMTRALGPFACERNCKNPIPFNPNEKPKTWGNQDQDFHARSSPENQSNQDNTESEVQMDSSTFEESGEPLMEQSSAKSLSDSEPDAPTTKTKFGPTRNAMSDERTTQTTVTSGTDGEKVNENDRTLSKESGNGTETPPEDSRNLPVLLSEERSDDKSLLTDSIKHMHGLMKSAGTEAPPNRKLEGIKCSIAAAREMTAMMKLKLEAHKFAKELTQ